MFYKITVEDYPQIQDFNKGTGFYIVEQTNQQISNVHYFNHNSFFWVTLDLAHLMPTEFLDMWDKPLEKEEKSEEKPSPNLVSEDFALKAMAIAKANTNTIKISDIIK